jgi:hypothetical protein
MAWYMGCLQMHRLPLKFGPFRHGKGSSYSSSSSLGSTTDSPSTNMSAKDSGKQEPSCKSLHSSLSKSPFLEAALVLLFLGTALLRNTT